MRLTVAISIFRTALHSEILKREAVRCLAEKETSVARKTSTKRCQLLSRGSKNGKQRRMKVNESLYINCCYALLITIPAAFSVSIIFWRQKLQSLNYWLMIAWIFSVIKKKTWQYFDAWNPRSKLISAPKIKTKA